MPKILVQKEMEIAHRTVGVRRAPIAAGEIVEVTDEELARLNPRFYRLLDAPPPPAQAKVKAKAKAKRGK